MFKRIIQTLSVYAMLAFTIVAPTISDIAHTDTVTETIKPIEIEEVVEAETVEVVMEKYISTPVKQEIHIIEKEEPVQLVEEIKEPLLSDEEIELIALVTMAEAEGESEEGKRLVIDTILNRVDSEISYFPDTVTEVIYQKNQFSSMWNGRVNRCYVDEVICELVREELESRTNNEVMYFHAGKYGDYGTPMFAEGNHYFSSV